MNPDPNWIDTTLRTARPRAMAALLRRLGSVEAAEEAFQEACLRALRHWAEQGTPRDPTAWLVRVGANAGIDTVRRALRETSLPADIAAPQGDAEDDIAGVLDEAAYGDDMLRLLFICCHKDLAATQQIALALRIVCGLSVADIASAFLVSEAAMEQRITRAKRAVAKADIRFEPPSPALRAERLGAVASMIYLLFTKGYAAASHEAARARPLCNEAIRLSRLLLDLFPEEPEVLGLAALLLLQDSRRDARFDAAGGVVLLEAQDRGRWDRPGIVEAIMLTDRAFRMGKPGPYQLQAAIAAMHARAPTFADTRWDQIEGLYRVLEDMWPTPVVALNHAVAIWRSRGPGEALAQAEPLATALDGYFPYHVVLGQLQAALGRSDEAAAAYRRALGLAESAAEAAQIRAYVDQL
ncbi:RNA polymerase sigma factor [Sphingopyxis sp. JAI128]|uniref:RNA polymerase sigma factor n=1 Tax=Sphingopyxis sp. JAI128 TaxID=2723066 RepID=UPI00161E3260|nr:DUF6596 domain-containing protein [Sphingopyxis sp. JAI128]MBB6426971.1 RNA polymerase sigma-70 factor (ECF subfamily) [Sphingopyxis sp. JAI128]